MIRIIKNYCLSYDIITSASYNINTLYLRWRRHARKDRKARIAARTYSLRRMFSEWCDFVPMQRRQKSLEACVERKWTRVQTKAKVQLPCVYVCLYMCVSEYLCVCVCVCRFVCACVCL